MKPVLWDCWLLDMILKRMPRHSRYDVSGITQGDAARSVDVPPDSNAFREEPGSLAEPPLLP